MKSRKMSYQVKPSGEWTVEMTWYEGDRHGPSRLVIYPTKQSARPAAGISQTVLRDIDFATMVEQAREFHDDREVRQELLKIDKRKSGRELAELSKAGLTPQYLAQLSKVYCAVAADESNPQARIAEMTGKSESAIKSHLWQAKRQGFLERSPGRRGGRVTEQAIRELLGAAEITEPKSIEIRSKST